MSNLNIEKRRLLLMSAGLETKLLNQFEVNNSWLNSNYNQLQEQHPNEFVAIDKKQVISCNKILQDLVKELKLMKVDTSLVLIEFVPEKGLKIIL